MNHIVYIGIGSNLGDRFENCKRAIQELRRNGADILSTSNLIDSEALTDDNEKQPSYINGAVKISTNLDPHKLLETLKNIERVMGRDPGRKKWSARTIDLDILFYDDLILNEKNLVIPHPEIQKRKFVLEPLCDIEPELVHPVLKKTIGAILCSHSRPFCHSRGSGNPKGQAPAGIQRGRIQRESNIGVTGIPATAGMTVQE